MSCEHGDPNHGVKKEEVKVNRRTPGCRLGGLIMLL